MYQQQTHHTRDGTLYLKQNTRYSADVHRTRTSHSLPSLAHLSSRGQVLIIYGITADDDDDITNRDDEVGSTMVIPTLLHILIPCLLLLVFEEVTNKRIGSSSVAAAGEKHVIHDAAILNCVIHNTASWCVTPCSLLPVICNRNDDDRGMVVMNGTKSMISLYSNSIEVNRGTSVAVKSSYLLIKHIEIMACVRLRREKIIYGDVPCHSLSVGWQRCWFVRLVRFQ